MPAPILTVQQLKAALKANREAGFVKRTAAMSLGLSRSAFQNRLDIANRRGVTEDSADEPIVSETEILRDRVRALESQLALRKREDLSDDYVRRVLLKVGETTPEPPRWLTPRRLASQSPGVPTLFLSDLHWGEVVDAGQVNGVNGYDLDTAQRRLRACVERAIDLLMHHMVKPSYPGIVVALGGDMVSGDIHEELSVTNETEIMPVFVDLFGCMVWVISTLADAFGKVFLPCVTGNHGRTTMKIRAKGRAYTSYDWLLYAMLQKHFQKDARITFAVPAGPDILYRVHDHRYLLTHGDQFRGGDGMIGPLGPITRGDHKKRSRNSQLGQDYDTLVMGHWHQLIALRKLIVNGSLKGYDEYAHSNNLPYEPPSQALWLTHPEHGITFSMPVYVERVQRQSAAPWVSWAAA